MRKPKKQKKPLNDLSRSLTPFDSNQIINGRDRAQQGKLARSRGHPWRGTPAVEEADARREADS